MSNVFLTSAGYLRDILNSTELRAKSFVHSMNIFRSRYAIHPNEMWNDCAYRVSQEVCEGLVSDDVITAIANAINEQKFIPSGRYLHNAGRGNFIYSNCLAMSCGDSKEEWAKLLHDVSLSLMKGIGIGTEFSGVRPNGSPMSSGGIASGSVSVMNMVNEIGHYVKCGGNRRCLPEGSLVYTSEGIKRIEQITCGDMVLTPNGYKRVLNTFEQGRQELLTIHTQIGELKCTPNHRVAVANGIHTYTFKEAQQLTPFDRLLVNSAIIEGTETFLPEKDEYPLPVKVKDIVYEGIVENTYDIEVESDHCFYANGYLVHNSALLAQLHWQHKDVDELLNAKQLTPKQKAKREQDYHYRVPLDNTNVSIRLDDAFFVALDKGDTTALDVYNRVLDSAIDYGEPGFLVNTGKYSLDILSNA